MNRIKALISVFLRINPGLFSLLSGMSIATAINFYTGTFSVDQLPAKWFIFLLASFLTIISAIFWAALYWKLDMLRAVEKNSSQRITWELLVAPKFKELSFCLVCAISTTIVGLGILPISLFNKQSAPNIQNDNTESKNTPIRTPSPDRDAAQDLPFQAIMAPCLNCGVVGNDVCNSTINELSISQEGGNNYLMRALIASPGKPSNSAIVFRKINTSCELLFKLDQVQDWSLSGNFTNGWRDIEVTLVKSDNTLISQIYKWDGSKYQLDGCLTKLTSPIKNVAKDYRVTVKPCSN